MAQLPDPPTFQGINFNSNKRTLRSVTGGFNTQTRRMPGHAFAFTARYPSLTEEKFWPVFAFLEAHDNGNNAFEVVLPNKKTPRGVGGGTPLVKGAGQTGKNVTTDGWPASTAVLLSGDILKFANHTKVYMVTADVTSDALGNATLPLNAELVSTPADNEAITINNVPFTVKQVGDVQKAQAEARSNGRWSYEVDLMEAVG